MQQARTPGDSAPYQSYASLRVTLTNSNAYVYPGAFSWTGRDVSAGPDGAIYFLRANALERIDAVGNPSHLDLNSNPILFDFQSLAVDPAGSFWLSQGNAPGFPDVSYAVLSRRPDGAFWAYAPATSQATPRELLATPNAIWSIVKNRVARFDTTSRLLTEYQAPYSLDPYISIESRLTMGPDNAVWITSPTDNKILRFSETNGYTAYTVPTAFSRVSGITAGPDGNLWFTEDSHKIGKLTPTGAFTEYDIGADTTPKFIAASATSNTVFFTSNNKVYRSTLSGTVSLAATLPNQASGITTASDGTVWAAFSESGMDGLQAVGQ